MIEILEGVPKGQPVPAISLRQPWAGALVYFGKDVENRANWPFKYRGPMIIHASATKAYLEDFEAFRELVKADGIEQDELDTLDPTKEEVFPFALFDLGAIVAVANLRDVFGPDDDVPEDHPVLESPWADKEAKYWLYFDAVIPVEPVPYKGLSGCSRCRTKLLAAFSQSAPTMPPPTISRACLGPSTSAAPRARRPRTSHLGCEPGRVDPSGLRPAR